jgi:hypothetical protein
MSKVVKTGCIFSSVFSQRENTHLHDRTPRPLAINNGQTIRLHRLPHLRAWHPTKNFCRRHTARRAQGLQVWWTKNQFACAVSEFEPKVHLSVPGLRDLCLIASMSLEAATASLQAANGPIVDGLVLRTEATGKIRLAYLRDLDLNLIEPSVHAESKNRL